MKLQFNTSPQDGINFLLYAVAPEAEFKHGCKGFGLSVGLRGLCIGAILKDFGNLFVPKSTTKQSCQPKSSFSFVQQSLHLCQPS